MQTPNGNADADTEVSPTSHEIMDQDFLNTGLGCLQSE